jgi:hypothetical protein
MLERNQDQPWLTDPRYGGMSPESARRSWEAGQRRQQAEDEEDHPPPAMSPDDYGSAEQFAEGATNAPRFVPVALDDVTPPRDPPWLIDNLLPQRGLACVVGAPKSRKSYFIQHMLASVARNVPYGGRATVQGPVIYLTGEGVSGFKHRLIAMRQHDGIEGQRVPFYMVDDIPDLGSERTDLPQLLRDLDFFIATEQLDRPRAIVLDTLARCMGGGDESTAKDMGRFITRCGAIERHFGCLVVVVHHAGKDPTRGGRGSNALNGAADVTITIEKSDAYSTATVSEMKDGPEGQTWRFRLLPYELSATSDTPRATSPEVAVCVVELLSEPSTAQPGATKTKLPPRGVAGDLLKIIRRAIEDAGETNVGSVNVPNNVRAVSRDTLKKYCATMAWQQEGADNAFRAMLSKTLSQLRERDLIGFDREWVWLV